jgi:hypothetical protein
MKQHLANTRKVGKLKFKFSSRFISTTFEVHEKHFNLVFLDFEKKSNDKFITLFCLFVVAYTYITYIGHLWPKPGANTPHQQSSDSLYFQSNTSDQKLNWQLFKIAWIVSILGLLKTMKTVWWWLQFSFLSKKSTTRSVFVTEKNILYVRGLVLSSRIKSRVYMRWEWFAIFK